jgi:hypothetical protein
MKRAFGRSYQMLWHERQSIAKPKLAIWLLSQPHSSPEAERGYTKGDFDGVKQQGLHVLSAQKLTLRYSPKAEMVLRINGLRQTSPSHQRVMRPHFQLRFPI